MEIINGINPMFYLLDNSFPLPSCISVFFGKRRIRARCYLMDRGGRWSGVWSIGVDRIREVEWCVEYWSGSHKRDGVVYGVLEWFV